MEVAEKTEPAPLFEDVERIESVALPMPVENRMQEESPVMQQLREADLFAIIEQASEYRTETVTIGNEVIPQAMPQVTESAPTKETPVEILRSAEIVRRPDIRIPEVRTPEIQTNIKIENAVPEATLKPHLESAPLHIFAIEQFLKDEPLELSVADTRHTAPERDEMIADVRDAVPETAARERANDGAQTSRPVEAIASPMMQEPAKISSSSEKPAGERHEDVPQQLAHENTVVTEKPHDNIVAFAPIRVEHSRSQESSLRPVHEPLLAESLRKDGSERLIIEELLPRTLKTTAPQHSPDTRERVYSEALVKLRSSPPPTADIEPQRSGDRSPTLNGITLRRAA